MHFDLIKLIEAVGYIGVFGIIFAESGLLIGFFLPGDSLLFAAGFLASQGFFNVYVLAVGCFIAAVVGDNVGYWFGKKVGKRIFHKQDSLLFHKDNLDRANAFYKKHGGKTIILARFMPVVRTFAPIVAGVGDMHYRTFFFYNILGGFLWTVGMIFMGYFLGQLIPAEKIDKYLLPIIGLIIVLSVAPSAIHILKDKENREQLKKTFRKHVLKHKE